MLYWKSRLRILAILLLYIWPLSAQEIPEPMVPYQLVNDFAGIFTDAGNRALSKTAGLQRFHIYADICGND